MTALRCGLPMRWLACALLCAAPLVTQPQPERSTMVWHAVADERLEALRGGFAAPGGVMVSFGITRTVHIDGQLAASMSVPLTDLRSITPAQAMVLAEQLSQVQRVQSGPGNVMPVDLGSGSAAMIVQNTLPDRQIRTVTQIDAVSNGMGLLKQMNLGETLQRSLSAALPR